MIKRLAILLLALGSWLLVFSQETVIVGEVPETYTYFERDENWDDNLERYDITS